MYHYFVGHFFFPAIAARTAIVAIILVVGLRCLGKRQLGQMNIYDLALILLLANAVQNAMTEGLGQLGAGFTSAGTLILMGAGLTYLFVRRPDWEGRIAGVPTVLISDGVLVKDHCDHERITHEILMVALRQHELFRVEQVKLAVLEPDGTISIVPKKVTTKNPP
jgi:uncharacterized membrane protein YcaP (DUF421 family)